MEINKNKELPNMLLSHVELYVKDLKEMTAFYTEKLGFVITDSGSGDNGMVFLSRSPNEHHQIVLSPYPSRSATDSPVDHISFRVDSLAHLKRFIESLLCSDEIPLQTVSHGSTWSIYFRDPEGNRFEIFTDTPWYVHQPCKFEVDFNLSDEALMASTLQVIRELPGFAMANDWQQSHQRQLKSNN
ncbi:glyoxalase [Pseudoalteromonas sp. MSK9-3]|uniref:VOC family protein n=1 Tax=Pseudoalteromonas sp. MSK9-3 TaxID=1897633 RepID=UPI000E6BFA1B|nr:VOC family protein [Pseudoalteromonas sp. MSK9-3]RJE73395.1 glyoxalase [Pseudoalteromonas sp. MSK9-3]